MYSAYFYQELLSSLISQYPFASPLIFIILRAISIPLIFIPGIALDVIGIFAFGWWVAFIYAEIGIMLGASFSFLIARHFRKPLLKKFLSIKKLNQLEAKLSKNQEFWALVALRLPSNSLFSILNYAAGITSIPFSRFFFSTLIGNIPLFIIERIFTYYFAEKSIELGPIYFILFILAIIIIYFIIVFGKSKKQS